MQIHLPSNTLDPAGFRAYLNTHRRNKPGFAVVEMGELWFYADTPEECEAAVRVWTEAARLLTEQQAAAEAARS
jgi:hypothetical protein